jgi:hypothetical protein
MWKIDFINPAVDELLDSLNQGPILNDKGIRKFKEKVIGKIDQLKVEIYADDHPPPHFHITYNNESNSYTIKDCKPLNGYSLQRYSRNIQKWHKAYKEEIIKCWNETRPTDCPVGKYSE